MKNTKNNVISNEKALNNKFEKYIRNVCKKYDLIYISRDDDIDGSLRFAFRTKNNTPKSRAKFNAAAAEIQFLFDSYLACRAHPTQLAA